MTTIDLLARQTLTVVYVGLLNVTLSIVFSQIILRYVSTKHSDARPRYMNVLRLAATLSSIILANQAIRRIVQRAPKPFKSDTFDPEGVAEIRGTVVTAFSFLMFLSSDLHTFKPDVTIA